MGVKWELFLLRTQITSTSTANSTERNLPFKHAYPPTHTQRGNSNTHQCKLFKNSNTVNTEAEGVTEGQQSKNVYQAVVKKQSAN